MGQALDNWTGRAAHTAQHFRLLGAPPFPMIVWGETIKFAGVATAQQLQDLAADNDH